MTYGVAETHGCVYHTRAHDAGKVCLDLEVDVVGAGITQPMTCGRRLHPVQNIVARLLVCKPQEVLGIGKRFREGQGGRIEAFVLTVLGSALGVLGGWGLAQYLMLVIARDDVAVMNIVLQFDLLGVVIGFAMIAVVVFVVSLLTLRLPPLREIAEELPWLWEQV